VVGKILLGPIIDKHHEHLHDAKWFEKLSTVTLVLAIAAIGIAPLWLSDTILVSLKPVIAKLAMAIPF
jgi:NADH-quinone oxidoreductase subunit M